MAYGVLKIFTIFTIVAAILYSLSPKKFRHIVLLLLSLACVGYYSKFGLVYLLITIVSTFIAGMVMDKIGEKHSTKGLEKPQRKAVKALAKKEKKRVVIGYIILNIGILFALKYSGMFIGTEHIPGIFKIAMPLGISYYTLQSLGYVIDVFRGKFKAESDPLKLALFVGFLPQLHEGPFGRYDIYKDDLFRNEPLKKDNVLNGLGIIVWGLFKIFMISNRAAMVSDYVFQNYKDYNGISVLVGGAFFTLQLYGEFSGYINIAEGISEIFGIHLVKNFNMPFIAKDVAEFWRRWHISLGSWFRDYIFYPVSTSKIFKKAPDFLTINSALLSVWFLTGLWHGASYKYIVYGLYYFVLMVGLNVLGPKCNKLLGRFNISKENKGILLSQILFTQLLVVIGMIMFRALDLTVFWDMIVHIFKGGNSLELLNVIDLKELAVLILSVGILTVSSILEIKNISFRNYFNKMKPVEKYFVCFGAACFVIIFGAYGLDYMPPDPIYGGF